MDPAHKSKAMAHFQDSLTGAIFNRAATKCIKNNICVSCGNPATTFQDKVSKDEFAISGLCQTCQNEVFKHE